MTVMAQAPRQPMRLLVVDDDPDCRSLVVELGRVQGFEAEGAGSAREALELISRRKPDLVITDLLMPEVDGAQLVAEVKKRLPDVPVIVMSVASTPPHVVRTMKSGADDYLVKPINDAAVFACLDAAAERRQVEQEARVLISLTSARSDRIVWGESRAMREVAARIPAIARTNAAAIIYGETGTGKELVARTLHEASTRAKGRFIAVNCASIPDNLWERELFGHVKGAFSGAAEGGPGLVELADGGTLFLDEVAEIPIALQAKLLRFLQEKQYRRVGSPHSKRANVRIVSATHRQLLTEVGAGRFREDLYYRLAVLPLRVPSLRERREDVPQLASHFMRQYAKQFDRPVNGFTPRAVQKLCSYDWPGNVRELENIVQQTIVAARYTVMTADDIPVGDPGISEPTPLVIDAAAPASAPAPDEPDRAPGAPGAPADMIAVDHAASYNDAKQRAIQRFEQLYVTRVLAAHDGNITRAAEASGLTRKSLSRIISRHQIRGGRPGRPRKRAD